jgi:diacylglycerol kinase family enzyme
MIAVFVNPRSRANRRNPKIAAELQAILGDTGRVFATRDLDELARVAADLHRAPPDVIAVHGGDGTLHKVLMALIQAWGDDPLPPLAPLCGGTMNVVASSLGLRDRPEAFVQHLADSARTGQALETLPRRCIRVGDQHGFIFGNGLMANFLAEYYAPGTYGPGRALWLIMRTLASAVVLGPFVRRVFDRFRGQVTIDGQPLPWSDFVSIGAATVTEVGMGFKLIHRADDDPERFGVIAIHAGPLSLIRDLVPVRAGRGLSTAHAFSAIATTMEIVPSDGTMAYTIDGDLYRTEGPLTVSAGPHLRLVKPAGGSLIALPRNDRNDTIGRP